MQGIVLEDLKNIFSLHEVDCSLQNCLALSTQGSAGGVQGQGVFDRAHFQWDNDSSGACWMKALSSSQEKTAQ